MSGYSGFSTLFYKEILRFWKVAFQTVLAPIITALLYLTIFGHALRGHVQVYPGVEYTSFLIPGLVMMSVLQNSFANSSSSLIQSKITGNLVFVLLPPLSHYEMFGAYVLAAVARGLAVGFGVFIVTIWFVPVSFSAPLSTSSGRNSTGSTPCAKRRNSCMPAKRCSSALVRSSATTSPRRNIAMRSHSDSASSR